MEKSVRETRMVKGAGVEAIVRWDRSQCGGRRPG